MESTENGEQVLQNYYLVSLYIFTNWPSLQSVCELINTFLCVSIV